MGPDAQRIDHLAREPGEAPGLERMYGEVAIIAQDGVVEVDHAPDELRVEHPDAAEIEQVDRVVVAHRIVAEMRIAMDQAVDMLERDLVAVDLRLPLRPTLRMTDGAVRELLRIRAIEAGEPLE